MKNAISKKLLILSIIFFCTALFVYGMGQPVGRSTKPPLSENLPDIPGYTKTDTIKLADDALQMLKLDDYFFADYQGPKGKVNLYIGYYYTAVKAYAAHSPLICYPSQGWTITSKARTGSLQVPPYTVNYEEITTSLADRKELVLFWYQSRLLTATQIYKNKFNMGYNKLVHHDQQHCFVRIAVPFADTGYAEAKSIAVTFIQSFYPQFARYIVDDGLVPSLQFRRPSAVGNP